MGNENSSQLPENAAKNLITSSLEIYEDLQWSQTPISHSSHIICTWVLSSKRVYRHLPKMQSWSNLQLRRRVTGFRWEATKWSVHQVNIPGKSLKGNVYSTKRNERHKGCQFRRKKKLKMEKRTWKRDTIKHNRMSIRKALRVDRVRQVIDQR